MVEKNGKHPPAFNGVREARGDGNEGGLVLPLSCCCLLLHAAVFFAAFFAAAAVFVAVVAAAAAHVAATNADALIER